MDALRLFRIWFRCAETMNPALSTMRNSIKQLILIVSIQVVCVGVGLLMHHQFVKHLSRSTIEKHAWVEMGAFSDHIYAKLQNIGWSANDDSPEVLRRVVELLTAAHPRPGGAMIVGPAWRVIVSADNEHHDVPGNPLVGVQLEWTRKEHAANEPMTVAHGELNIFDGPHLAVARPLDNSKGFVVVHRSVTDIFAPVTAMMDDFPAITGVLLLWIGALLAVVDYLVLSRIQERANRERTEAANKTLQRSQNLIRTRDAVIFGLAKLADSRDPETGDHLDRISYYSAMLAAVLQRNPKYAKTVTPTFVNLIRTSSALHDIGKVGIEDKILRKADDLTADERASMETHTLIGGECLREIELRLGSSNFLQMAREIALAHHERWDGTGYPYGLAREEIPLAARIVAITDVYDALASKRIYKDAFPHGECVAIIQSQAGKQFDPDLVEIWLTVEPRFREIALRYSNSSGAAGPSESVEDQPGTESLSIDLQPIVPEIIDAL